MMDKALKELAEVIIKYDMYFYYNTDDDGVHLVYTNDKGIQVERVSFDLEEDLANEYLKEKRNILLAAKRLVDAIECQADDGFVNLGHIDSELGFLTETINQEIQDTRIDKNR